MKLRNYRLIRQLDSEESCALSEALLGISKYFQLIERREGMPDSLLDTTALPPILKKHLISVSEVDEWPGTKLHYGHKAISYLIESNVEIAQEKVDLLFSMDGQFEDASFFRLDGSLMLGSISHENDVWFRLDDSEYLFLSSIIPGAITFFESPS